MSARRAIHLYCTVIDNFGDIGVCWRLARQLAQEHDQEVHLWVDDMPAARALIARLPADGLALAEGVQLARWPTQADSDLTGDVLIEGFGCALPDATLAQLAARARKPLWIDLEYFSAEEWVPRFHLGSSIDAATRTRRWFFFPGVHAHSGGILRERGLVGARNAWQRPPGPRTHLCFGYPHAPYAEWLRALALPGAPLALWLCGQYTQAAFPAEQRAALPAGVTVRDLPFVAQPEFDQMLWSADVLWVRGEDSMARALWSGKPFVWQIYPQSERAHHPKLDAWLACYTRGFPGSLAAAYRDAHLAWNAIEDAPPFTDAWARLDALRDDWAAHSRARSDALAQDADLAQRLLAFIDQTPPPV